MFGLLLADARGALASLGSQLLAESVFNVVADQHASSVGVLRVSNFRVVGHFICYCLF